MWKCLAELPPFPWLLKGSDEAVGEAELRKVTLVSQKMKLLSGELDLYIFRFSKFL